MKSRQQNLFSVCFKNYFGGSRLKSNPKTARPLSTKHSLHLVLKTHYSMGPYTMLQTQHAKVISKIIKKQATNCGIKVYQLVNVGNHLHIVIRLGKRHLYSKFIRSITGLIARKVMKKERGNIRTSTENNQHQAIPRKFWIARPFSRIISWGNDFKNVINYMNKNTTQAHWRKHFVAWGFEVVDPVKIQLLNTA